MTTKVAPEAPKAPQTLTFWDKMKIIRAEIQKEAFGKAVTYKTGGGTKFKDTEALVTSSRKLFIEHNIHFVASPHDLKTEAFVLGDKIHYLTSGEFLVEFFDGDEVVYSTKSYGSFDDTSSAQATHGALTVAKSSFLFNILDASLNTEDELEEKRRESLNKQAKRTAATPTSGNPY